MQIFKNIMYESERYIWEHPQTGFKEWDAHNYLKGKFVDMGFELKEAGDIPGFSFDIDTGKVGPTVAIIGELDALIIPGDTESGTKTCVMHACGHNCQVSALLGIAGVMKDNEILSKLCGKIRIIAVPAEELTELSERAKMRKDGKIKYLSGKTEFMSRGFLDDVDLATMVHTAGGKGINCIGGSNGCVVKTATFLGKSSHAASASKGINALYAANLAMQAANSLRETFKESDTIRFHPIITNGGTVVNAIPDTVSVESYLRGGTMEAIEQENKKVNRAFAGAAAAMGCKLVLKDLHGYAPQYFSPIFKQAAKDVALAMFPSEEVNFTDVRGVGCTDMGDVSCIMPIVQTSICGAEGAGHGITYRIKDPYNACVLSAKYQVRLLVHLLREDAAVAKEIVNEEPERYMTVAEYLAKVDQTEFDGQTVTYNEDGTVALHFVK
jgi:amidohydrolase